MIAMKLSTHFQNILNIFTCTASVAGMHRSLRSLVGRLAPSSGHVIRLAPLSQSQPTGR